MKNFIRVLGTLTASAIVSTASAKGPASTPELVEKGKQSYTVNCAACHGEKGDGNGPAGAMMNPKPRNFGVDKFKKGDSVEQIFASVTKGLPGTSMSSFAHVPEQERWGIAYYIAGMRPAKPRK